MSFAPIASARDARLDFFRGLCLAMIFINHVPGQIYENYTSRNFGFTDAAEGFVFMAGAAAGLAYSAGLARKPRWLTVSKIWGRAWLLYLVHVMVAFVAVAIAAAVLRFGGDDAILSRANMEWFGKDLTGFMIGIPLLTHQLGYVNILPMYIVLLLAAPALIWAALRAPKLFLAGSLALWALSGQFRLDLPNYPTSGLWFFNPIAWEIIFALGLLTGIALKQGRRFVPVHRGLFWASVAYLIFSYVWLHWEEIGVAGGHFLSRLGAHGVPFYIIAFDKTYVALPRLLHLMALAYVLSMPGIIPRIAASRVAAPFVTLGQNALPVFAFGTILAFVAQAIKVLHPAGTAQDTAIIVTGLALQWALARARQWHKAQVKAARG